MSEINTKKRYSFPEYHRSFYERFVKRFLDIVISIFALIVLSPVLLVISIAVRVNLGKPVFFKQVRIGINEKPFTIVKFRSMRDGKDKNGRFLPDSERLTSFGRALREASLDELPELWNVLKGDMALIGPRPLPKVYLPFFKQEERVRHAIRGGLTGLAQVRGRNSISWDDKFALDVEYTERVSFRLDIQIFFETIAKVIRRSDIGERGISSPEDLDVERKPQEWYTMTYQGKQI